MSRVYNFSAGPAILPQAVLERAAKEMLDWNNTGMSVMEMSHRSKTYIAICQGVEQKLREVMGVPEDYKVLFLQGGATLQFSAVPMNLIAPGGKADYAVTGNFSKAALKAALRYGEISTAVDTGDYSVIEPQNQLKLDPEASYFHYCHNNTVYGTVWPYIPQTGAVPVVSDMSSCILSEPIDVSKFGLIYAGAQKNMGPAGLTVVIIKDDLLERQPLAAMPALLSYREQAKAESMMNTPPAYGIYILGLVLDWIEGLGGLKAMRQLNKKKAALLYKAIDESETFSCPAEAGSRSMMNIVFKSGSEETDSKFIKEAAVKGLVTLKGHRAAGGMRASIYNAMPIEGVEKLVEFIRTFNTK
ncbi:MAG: 3-phosphoserine/phosphohydroxythreonine transaminase [Oscillospiraceae bacterium]|nr:3-phosphoserine/phosphohydroxythreonine transaminase [Oscillospiraceae bacterium]